MIYSAANAPWKGLMFTGRHGFPLNSISHALFQLRQQSWDQFLAAELEADAADLGFV